MNELARIEATTDIAPITDQVHSLLLDSIAKISDQWIEQLKIVRENTITLENQILACVTKTKSDIHAAFARNSSRRGSPPRSGSLPPAVR